MIYIKYFKCYKFTYEFAGELTQKTYNMREIQTRCSVRRLCSIWPSFSKSHLAALSMPECADLDQGHTRVHITSWETPVSKEIPWLKLTPQGAQSTKRKQHFKILVNEIWNTSNDMYYWVELTHPSRKFSILGLTSVNISCFWYVPRIEMTTHLRLWWIPIKNAGLLMPAFAVIFTRSLTFSWKVTTHPHNYFKILHCEIIKYCDK